MELSPNVVAGLTIALGSLGPSLAIGKLASAAMEALGRNPDAERAVSTNLIIALAFTEAIAIYALVVALSVKFVA
ncbi:MAG: ATP synthase F0 subunit C [Anaerolineae bacterium]|jgi:F-type H+-transporting ATPase subunit c|nr:ATP synthase F0 subunit C [Chloroflexota bacterium]